MGILKLIKAQLFSNLSIQKLKRRHALTCSNSTPNSQGNPAGVTAISKSVAKRRKRKYKENKKNFDCRYLMNCLGDLGN